jgi:hypothetical protein
MSFRSDERREACLYGDTDLARRAARALARRGRHV